MIAPKSPEQILAELKQFVEIHDETITNEGSRVWLRSSMASLLVFAAQEALPEAETSLPDFAPEHEWNSAIGEYLDNLNELADKIAEG